MRRVVLTDEATHQLHSQIEFLLDRNAVAAARTLRARVEQFLSQTLVRYPGTGKCIPGHDLWETWIPGTRLIVWYQHDDATLTVLTFWHASQHRQPAP